MRQQDRGRSRHTPIRMCAVCRQRLAKRELIRMVYAMGKLQIDETGKLAGRGAYICKKTDCWSTAAKSDVLGRVLKVDLSAEDTKLIATYIRELGSETVIKSGH